MSKSRIFLAAKVIFLSMVGIFAISSVKIHGDYCYLYNRNFLNSLYDEKERAVFVRLYEYMNTTTRIDRKYQLESFLPQEFRIMFDKKSRGLMNGISKRGYKYALGEVLNKVIPVFEFSDEDALNLASVYLGVEPEVIAEVGRENGAKCAGCKELSYKMEGTLMRKIAGVHRFYFIFDETTDDGYDSEYW